LPKTGYSNCQVCDIKRSTDDWSWGYNGTWCQDKIYCNGVDSCVWNDATNASTCSAHSGDPCTLNTEFCNNTCSESTKSCHREDYLSCGASTICSSEQCFFGACTNISFADGTICGDDELCAIPQCQAGECLRSSKVDGMPCGNETECTVETCVSGECLMRSPEPIPSCSLCPCGSDYSCEPASGLCVYNTAATTSFSQGLHMMFYIGIGIGSGALLVLTALFVYPRVVGGRAPALKYALLEVEADNPNDPFFLGLPTTAPTNSGVGGGAREPANSRKVMTGKKTTSYVRADEDGGHRTINKKY
jgi:hypothetical protein